jgi:membrane fusion protein, heavy metal efflux system
MIKYIKLIISLTILSACNDKQAKSETEVSQPLNENIVELTDAQLKNVKIQTGKIDNRSISSLLKVNGIIDVPPQNMVSISVPLGGYLKSTQLLEGMYIRKGQTIAVMEDQQYISLQQDYLTAKVKIDFVEEEYKRQEELNKSKAVSDKVFQQAKSDFFTQRILLKSLAEKLRLIGINPDKLNENSLSRSINISSPIDGFVSKVNVNIGKYANPSDILFELVNPTDIHLALNIFEKDINSLYIGQRLVAFTNRNPEKKYLCKIILIGKNLNEERSVEVHCHFEQYDKTLIPGMYLNAEIEMEKKSGFTLPTEAIVSFEGKQYVFEVGDNKQYKKMEVAVQNNQSGFTQITFPDNKDRSKSLFVIKGAYSLLMKMKNTEEE